MISRSHASSFAARRWMAVGRFMEWPSRECRELREATGPGGFAVLQTHSSTRGEYPGARRGRDLSFQPAGVEGGIQGKVHGLIRPAREQDAIGQFHGTNAFCGRRDQRRTAPDGGSEIAQDGHMLQAGVLV